MKHVVAPRSPLTALLGTGLAVALVSAVIAVVNDYVPVLSLGVLYILAVLVVALFWGSAYATLAAVVSMLAFNFLFLPPLYTFTLADGSNWFALAVYVVTAIVVGTLAARSRRRASEAEQREREAALLADVATELLRGSELDAELDRLAARTTATLGVSSARIELAANQNDAGHDSHRLTADGVPIGTLYTPAGEPPPPGTTRRLLPALAALLGVAQERERLAQEAFESETLRRSDAVKTAVIQAVSHDLRTPLATIEAALDGLESGEIALTVEDRVALLDSIRIEHTRLKRLVEDLLDLSRLQAGAAKPERELWPVAELVEQAIGELGADRRVTVAMSAELSVVRVDAAQIERVLVNLLDDALRFSPPDEPVTVRVTATRQELLIRVVDAGPGVPEAERERIFEPFHRLATGEKGGAGLGLAIARGFAEANGGRLWIESRAGQGASFVLALPAVAARAGVVA